MGQTDDLAAGEFSTWLAEMDGALRGERDADVPCGTCTACCTASQFVHIGPDETDALAHIPKALLFAAPRMPAGHVLMGYDQRGHCPMLVDDQCSIYDHRPRTCRTYDCRVFPASGVELDAVDDADKVLIAAQAARWRFADTTAGSRTQRDAVRSAAVFLADHPDAHPGGIARSATELAVRAVEAHRVFLRTGDSAPHPSLNPDEVRIEFIRRRLTP
jgi:uncharacterized protein